MKSTPSARPTIRGKPLVEKTSEMKAKGLPGWKRAVDITFSLAAMPVLAVCTLMTATVMALVSPGPVLFRQERVGYRGRRFMCYKFRTMHVGADSTVHQEHCEQLIQSNAPMEKMDIRGDSRLIPGSRLIRAAGLDELPQILNVLRGEMSLVGPRPCLPYEYEKYLPWQRARCNAMPGLTGLWQVSGKNRTTFDEMIRLDIYYAVNLSFWQDLKITTKTVPALLLQLRDMGKGPRAPAQTRKEYDHRGPSRNAEAGKQPSRRPAGISSRSDQAMRVHACSAMRRNDNDSDDIRGVRDCGSPDCLGSCRCAGGRRAGPGGF
jgi:lipopolysaccharide/colanic/teichoic acid biosynthesis glycosyltransferase